MLKAFKRGLVNCVKLLQKVLKNIYEYIRKLFKSNVSQKTEAKDSEPTFVQEQSVELERENTLQVSRNNSADHIGSIRTEDINNHDFIIALQYNTNLSNHRINNDEISNIEKCSRKGKYKNIRYVLQSKLAFSDIENIFGVDDSIFNRIKDDVELLKVALQYSRSVDDIINVYSQGTTKLKIIKSILEISADSKSTTDSILAYFECKIGPIVQMKYQQKCNLDYLLKGVLLHREGKKPPIPSLQQICIENLIRNTGIQKNVF